MLLTVNHFTTNGSSAELASFVFDQQRSDLNHVSVFNYAFIQSTLMDTKRGFAIVLEGNAFRLHQIQLFFRDRNAFE
jgi:hypothetical protein